MGVTVTVENLVVETRPKRGAPKVLLRDVAFSACPGEMVAIMGPSGSGKTTLLNVLSNRARELHVAGTIAFNGKSDMVKHANKFSCYVMQEDAFLEHLTVIETLSYAAKLRLSHLSADERAQRVNFVLDRLGLESCKDVIIGGERTKGISGGQKKRVSIAVALLARPALIYLDEPTSGLDAALAYDVIKTVEYLCHEYGHTVICTIHQPRSQVFSLFDSLVLLRAGEVCYRGPALGALTWFASVGHPCPPEFNPPDFFLDLLTTTGVDDDISAKLGNPPNTAITTGAEEEEPDGSTVNKTLQNRGSATRVFASEGSAERLVKEFQESEFNREHLRQIEALKLESEQDEIPECEKDPTNPLLRNAKAAIVLAEREMKNDRRNPKVLWTNFAEGVAVLLVTGTIWFQVEKPVVGEDCDTTRLRNLLGGFLQMIGFFSFGSFDAAINAVQRRPLINREASAGLYHRSTRFLSNMMSDFPPKYFTPVFAMTAVYWMMGGVAAAEPFFAALGIAISVKWAAMSLAGFAGHISPIEPIAMAILPIFMVNMLLTSGFQLADDKIPSFIGWYKYLSFLRYGFQGLSRTQFMENQEYLDRCLGFQTPHSPWMSVLYSFLVGLGFRGLGVLSASTLHKSQGLSA